MSTNRPVVLLGSMGKKGKKKKKKRKNKERKAVSLTVILCDSLAGEIHQEFRARVSHV